MDAIISPPKRSGVAAACRRIRGRWGREERRRRRRMADAMQRELWRLLEAVWRLSADERVGSPVSVPDATIVRSHRSTGALCFPW